MSLRGVNWFEFHLSSFKGVAVTFPVIPDDALICLRLLPLKIIAAIQVRIKAGIKPPSSFVISSTVGGGSTVVVMIFSGESHATMMS